MKSATIEDPYTRAHAAWTVALLRLWMALKTFCTSCAALGQPVSTTPSALLSLKAADLHRLQSILTADDEDGSDFDLRCQTLILLASRLLLLHTDNSVHTKTKTADIADMAVKLILKISKSASRDDQWSQSWLSFSSIFHILCTHASLPSLRELVGWLFDPRAKGAEENACRARVLGNTAFFELNRVRPALTTHVLSLVSDFVGAIERPASLPQLTSLCDIVAKFPSGYLRAMFANDVTSTDLESGAAAHNTQLTSLLRLLVTAEATLSKANESIPVHTWSAQHLGFVASARRLQWAVIVALTLASQRDSVAASKHTEMLLSAFSAQWEHDGQTESVLTGCIRLAISSRTSLADSKQNCVAAETAQTAWMVTLASVRRLFSSYGVAVARDGDGGEKEASVIKERLEFLFENSIFEPLSPYLIVSRDAGKKTKTKRKRRRPSGSPRGSIHESTMAMNLLSLFSHSVSAAVAAVRGDGGTRNLIGADTSADDSIDGQTRTENPIGRDESGFEDNIFEGLLRRAAKVLTAAENTVVKGACPALYLSSILRISAGMAMYSSARTLNGVGESGGAVERGKNSRDGGSPSSVLSKVVGDIKPNKRARKLACNQRDEGTDKSDISQPPTLAYLLQTAAVSSLSQSNVWDSSVDQSKGVDSDLALASAEYLSSICSLGTFEDIFTTLGVRCSAAWYKRLLDNLLSTLGKACVSLDAMPMTGTEAVVSGPVSLDKTTLLTSIANHVHHALSGLIKHAPRPMLSETMKRLNSLVMRSTIAASIGLRRAAALCLRVLVKQQGRWLRSDTHNQQMMLTRTAVAMVDCIQDKRGDTSLCTALLKTLACVIGSGTAKKHVSTEEAAIVLRGVSLLLVDSSHHRDISRRGWHQRSQLMAQVFALLFALQLQRPGTLSRCLALYTETLRRMLATIFAWALATALARTQSHAEPQNKDNSPSTSKRASSSIMGSIELATRRACRLLVRLLDAALDKGGGAYRRYSGYLIADYIRLCIECMARAPGIAILDDALKPIVYRLFELASTHETQQLHISLDLAQKSLLQTLHNSFKKNYKHTGKV